MSTMITTTPAFEGYKITDYCGIVSSQAFYVNKLKMPFEVRVDEVRQEAIDLLWAKLPAEANAIVGVRMEHTGKFYLNDTIVITGTAVHIEKI